MGTIDAPAVAAFLSAVATVFAAYATWQGPRSAAEIAEKLRRSAEEQGERKRLKHVVFYTLMQERAFLASTEAVRALNLIDVIYRDSLPVREAWAELLLSFDSKHNVPLHTQDERLRKMLREMAIDLGLGEALRMDDFGRSYYPNALAQEEAVRRLEREAALKRLQGQPATANTAQAAPVAGPFPPRP